MKKGLIFIIIFLDILLGFSTVQARWVGITDGTHRAKITSFGSIQVESRLSSQPLFMIPLHQVEAETTLATDGVIDEYTIDLTDTTGFIADNMVIISDPTNLQIYIGEQVGSPVTGTITLDRPLDFDYTAGLMVTTNNKNLAVDGGTTTQAFGIRQGVDPELDITVDIYRTMLTMLTGTTPDLGSFGDLPSLTYGCTLRERNGNRVNIFNIKNNADFASLAYDTQLLSAIGGGADGVIGRLTFTKIGSVIRISPDEDLEVIIKDDLSGLTNFLLVVEGSIVILEED